jgi:Ca2+-binding RTX toxin-like protein
MVVSSITLDLSDNIVETGKFMEDMKASDPAGGINLSGNRLDNSLIGNDYDNQLFGEIGNDSLIGGNGYDWLSGDDGNDWLLGALLTGDKEFTQIDTLTGGAGADTFALNSVFNGDTDTLRYLLGGQFDYALIMDFEIGVDKLNLGSGSFGFGNLPAGITTGQALYYTPPLPAPSNLIAVIQTTTGNPANLADL